ncbi:YqzM family protein [Bacillus daqingensis]|uniref:YqzM family protein n=1 Tax=Bacillus daqingensis TaxID=872396 RepID=A0ABV9P1K5_9BACI
MNEFEKDVQSNRNDAIDSAIGFIASFVFFMGIFSIGHIVDLFF